jgi:hypothetical protein
VTIDWFESIASGGKVERQDGIAHLEIPAGPAGSYRLAQLDDYRGRRRSQFAWRDGLRLELKARASAADIKGTWGFGLWNDPFSMSLLSGGLLRLPALPNTAWFFFGSPPNYLSLRDDLPANGLTAGVFRSPPFPSAWMAAGAPALPLLAFAPTTRLLRRLGRGFVRQQTAAVDVDLTGWHTYTLDWRPEGTNFQVDGATVLESRLSPRGPLGLVIWIDNQFLAMPPDGRTRYGWLETPAPAWIEVADIGASG